MEVSCSWELVKRNQQGQETVLATQVSAYDITADDEIVYSNGCGVFLLDDANEPKLILKDKLVAEVFS